MRSMSQLSPRFWPVSASHSPPLGTTVSAKGGGGGSAILCQHFGDQEMTVQATSSSLERELEFRKKLTAITNQINSAESIPHILMTLQDKILDLIGAERPTTYT